MSNLAAVFYTFYCGMIVNVRNLCYCFTLPQRCWIRSSCESGAVPQQCSHKLPIVDGNKNNHLISAAIAPRVLAVAHIFNKRTRESPRRRRRRYTHWHHWQHSRSRDNDHSASLGFIVHRVSIGE